MMQSTPLEGGEDPAPAPDWSVESLRPLRPDDAEGLRQLVDRVSVTSLQRRFFTPVRALARAFMERLVAETGPCAGGVVLEHEGAIVAVAEYHLVDCGETAELAVLVDDGWRRMGVGRAIVREAVRAARRQGAQRLSGSVLYENRPALAMLGAQAPDASRRRDGVTVDFTIELPPPRQSSRPPLGPLRSSRSRRPRRSSSSRSSSLRPRRSSSSLRSSPCLGPGSSNRGSSNRGGSNRGSSNRGSSNRGLSPRGRRGASVDGGGSSVDGGAAGSTWGSGSG